MIFILKNTIAFQQAGLKPIEVPVEQYSKVMFDIIGGFSKETTFRDVCQLFLHESYVELWNELFRLPLDGQRLQPFLKELQRGQSLENDTEYEYMFIGPWTRVNRLEILDGKKKLYSVQDELCIGLKVRGENCLDDADGLAMDVLANIPVKLCTDYYCENAKNPSKPSQIGFKDIRVVDMLQAIFETISMYGSPKERTKQLAINDQFVAGLAEIESTLLPPNKPSK